MTLKTPDEKAIWFATYTTYFAVTAGDPETVALAACTLADTAVKAARQISYDNCVAGTDCTLSVSFSMAIDEDKLP
jgi:hypothetical protein